MPLFVTILLANGTVATSAGAVETSSFREPTGGEQREEVLDLCRPQVLGDAVKLNALDPARLAQVEFAQQLLDANAVMATAA